MLALPLFREGLSVVCTAYVLVMASFIPNVWYKMISIPADIIYFPLKLFSVADFKSIDTSMATGVSVAF